MLSPVASSHTKEIQNERLEIYHEHKHHTQYGILKVFAINTENTK